MKRRVKRRLKNVISDVFWVTVTAPLWIPVLVLGMVVMIIYAAVVLRPIWTTLAIHGREHLTWKDLKRLSGARTANVLIALEVVCREGLVTARLRDKATLERLVRHYHKPLPRPTDQIREETVIFYEFRYIHNGGKRSRWSLTSLLPVLVPKPVNA
jgi:hypothetical protein